MKTQTKTTEDDSGSAAQRVLKFDEADRILFEEVRVRFGHEEARNATYQGKTGLFLAFSGFFSALVSATLANVLDSKNWTGRPLEWLTLLALGLCLLLLLVTIWMLINSSIAKKYETIASPEKWRRHLDEVRGVLRERGLSEHDRVVLQQDLCDALIVATEKSSKVNDGKAAYLLRAAKLMKCLLCAVAIGMILFLGQAVSRPKGDRDMGKSGGEGGGQSGKSEGKPAGPSGGTNPGAAVVPPRPENKAETWSDKTPKEQLVIGVRQSDGPGKK